MSDLAITIFQFSLQISDLNSRNFRRSSDLAGEFPPPNPNHRPLVTCYSRFQAVAQAQTAGPMAKYANVEPSSYAVRHFPHQSPRSLHVVCHFQAVWKSELEAPECFSPAELLGLVGFGVSVQVHASKERLGDRILHCLNVLVVPMLDKSVSPAQVPRPLRVRQGDRLTLANWTMTPEAKGCWYCGRSAKASCRTQLACPTTTSSGTSTSYTRSPPAHPSFSTGLMRTFFPTDLLLPRFGLGPVYLTLWHGSCIYISLSHSRSLALLLFLVACDVCCASDLHRMCHNTSHASRV